MAVGKNKRLSKSKKGLKKRTVDPFTRKEWFAIHAPGYLGEGASQGKVGLTLVNKSAGLKNSADSLKGRVLSLSLADLNKDEDLAFRSISLKVESVLPGKVLTNFNGMSITADKTRSIVKKYQSLIECSIDAKTTDGYFVRLFIIASTKKAAGQIRKTSYAQSSQIRAIRAKMTEIAKRESDGVDLKELVSKFIPEVIGKEVERACKTIYPITNCLVRKCKILRAPKTDLAKLMEMHSVSDAAAAAAGKTIKTDFVEPEVLTSV